MCLCPDAFLSLRPCAIEVVGVSGSLSIFGVGTAMFVVTAASSLPVTILIHDCLLSQGSPFNLLSVSQFQASGRHTVDFSVSEPSLHVRTLGHTGTRSIRSPQATTIIPLVACDGLYGFYAEPLHPNDNRYSSLLRFHLTTRSEDDTTSDSSLRAAGVATRAKTVRFEPRGFTGIVSSWIRELDDEVPSSKAAPQPSDLDTGILSSAATPLGHWSCKLLVSSSNARRILAFPSGDSLNFDSELRAFCDGFLSPVTIPPARRTYDPPHGRSLGQVHECRRRATPARDRAEPWPHPCYRPRTCPPFPAEKIQAGQDTSSVQGQGSSPASRLHLRGVVY